MTSKSENVNRREFLGLMGSGAAGVLAGHWLAGCAQAAPSATAQAARRKPNIVLIFADDMGYGDPGCYGGKDIPTPHIDALATGGMKFTHAYVSGPVCSPSRAGLLTGRYQQRFGHENNPGTSQWARENTGLHVDERTIGNHLKKGGYVSGIVGKWHLGIPDRFFPTNRGFDEFFGFLEGWHRFVEVTGDHRPVFRNDKPIQVEERYFTEILTDEAKGFIRRHKDEPFFLYVPYNAPHTPLEATEKYLKRFEHIQDETRRVYAAMVSALDDGVGELMATLKELKLEEDTLVFFVSDNGGPTPVTSADNGPLSGRKGQLLEGGIRVPWIAYWKGHVPAGTVCEQPVIALDVVPTALALAGVEPPTDKPLDGVSLLPILTGGKADQPVHEYLFWRIGGEGAVRKGDWKYVRSDGQNWRLFNVATDPGETTDLSAEKPEIVADLRAAYQKWNAQLVPPSWTYDQ